MPERRRADGERPDAALPDAALPDAGLAADILRLLGGPVNVTALTHCFVRLRFELRDRAEADGDALGALDGVAIALWQGDQLHVVPRARLLELYGEISSLLEGEAV